jgi:hypothetical protein
MRATFILRLWHEPGTPAGEWRVELEHVQSARIVRFADPALLLAFVRSWLGELERSSAPPPEAGRTSSA